MKKCSMCKVEQELSAFNKNQRYCRACQIKGNALSVTRHPETRRKNRASRKARELAVNRAYKKANKDRINAINRSRKARMKYARYDRHDHEDVKFVYAMQRGKCAVCRQDVGAKYHVDHVIPLALGGENGRLNLQILCPPCNLDKRSQDPIQFMQSKGMLL